MSELASKKINYIPDFVDDSIDSETYESIKRGTEQFLKGEGRQNGREFIKELKAEYEQKLRA